MVHKLLCQGPHWEYPMVTAIKKCLANPYNILPKRDIKVSISLYSMWCPVLCCASSSQPLYWYILSYTVCVCGVTTWWARQIRSRSCLCRNLATTSEPNVNDTPLSFSPQPRTSLSGSDQSKSHSRPWSGTSVGRMMRLICSMDCRSGDSPVQSSYSTNKHCDIEADAGFTCTKLTSADSCTNNSDQGQTGRADEGSLLQN